MNQMYESMYESKYVPTPFSPYPCLRAMASCEAVSVALRSSTLRASLGLTVYVSTAAGPGGPQAALREVERMLDSGSLDGGLEPVQGKDLRGEDDGSAETEEEGEGGSGQVDSYLQMAKNMPSCLKPNITLVIVEALPRG